MFVILVLALQFTEITGQFSPTYVVREGDDVTLPCDIMRDDRCEKTNWLFSKSQDAEIIVSEGGQVCKNTEKLKVMTNCSLVIKKVSDEDDGFYTCRSIHSRGHLDAKDVYLFLITMTEKEEGEHVRLPCFVSTSRTKCTHTEEWMDEEKTVEDAEIIHTSRCLVTVVIPASFLKENPKYLERFSCKLKDDDTKIDQLFAHSPQSSGNDANTTKPDGRKTDVTVPAIRDTPTTPLNLWLYIVVTLGVVALITTVAVIILWRRREDSIMLQDEEQILNSAVVSSNPETSPNMRV
ncbi:hypothetical protein CHARACLAT_010253 [Characodon lateralis]|uniref:Ig-like domain-containing protein n=1 Tax=Characodon lateralis TaxID=208331 RepID=A0ABU7D5L0_9TELE|nr:hypothetical protein [Characodon lateralis]